MCVCVHVCSDWHYKITNHIPILIILLGIVLVSLLYDIGGWYCDECTLKLRVIVECEGRKGRVIPIVID